MLDRASDDVGSRGLADSSEDRGVIGLGATAGEDKLLGVTVQKRCNLSSRPLQSVLCSLAQGVNTGGIAEHLAQRFYVYLQHIGGDWRSCVVVEVKVRHGGGAKFQFSKMPRPIITLITDFGTRDHFVGVLHGVIRGICREADIVDITHEVAPFQIGQGAFLLAQTVPYFPEGTIHVAIVDPGVGTERRPVLVECSGYYLIGPDNGVLASTYSGQPHTARQITNESLFRNEVSRTFHGRDVFAPVAAHLASGVAPELVGPTIDNHWKLSFQEPQRTSKRAWSGTVLHIDRFGNLITNFHIRDFEKLTSVPFTVFVGPRQITSLAANYSQIPLGEVAAVIGSSGHLEICANQQSAHLLTGVGLGAPCDLQLHA